MTKQKRQDWILDRFDLTDHDTLLELINYLTDILKSAKQDVHLEWDAENGSCYLTGYIERIETDEEEAEREKQAVTYAARVLLQEKQLFEQLKQKHGW